jgi:hypothetical protein
MIAGPALVLLGLAARWMPERVRPMCLSHRITGFPCPGCGSFRAFSLLAEAEWRRAFLTQPLMTMLATALLLASAGAWLLWALKKQGPRTSFMTPRAWKWLIAGLVAALLANWAYLVGAGV